MGEAGGMQAPPRPHSGSLSRVVGAPDAMRTESVAAAAAAGDIASSLIVSPPPAIQPRYACVYNTVHTNVGHLLASLPSIAFEF